MVSNGLLWELTADDVSGFDFGEVDIMSELFTTKGLVTTKGQLFSRGRNRVAGYIDGSIKIGTDHKINKITFHLHDYTDLYGEKETQRQGYY